MKYRTESDSFMRNSQFIVSIEDTELYSYPGSKLSRFEDIILSRLANIIVGYLFKHRRDELISLVLEGVKEKVAREVSKDILARLGLPLEG